MNFLKINDLDIPFIFEENNDLPIIVLKLVFRNSGRISDGEFAGLSRIFARILNEGVDDNFFKNLDFKAINLDSSSNFETFEINISCLKENFKFALESLINLLLNPRFDEKILNKVKISAISELASKNNDFDYLAKVLLNKISFKNKDFYLPNDGNKDTIEKISLKKLDDFYKKNIALNNLVISLGGDIKEQNAKELLSTYFSKLHKGIKVDNKFYKIEENQEDVLIKKDSQQAYIYFSSFFDTDFKDKNFHLAKIALFVLGQGGFGSRLMEEIRVKRGLAYSAYAMLDINLSYKRVFGYLQTKNESSNEAIKLVKDIFNDFVKNGVSENELKQAKNFLIGSLPLRYESLNKRLAISFDEFYYGLEKNAFKKSLLDIEKTNLEQLNEYIKKHSEIIKLNFASVKNEN